MTAHSAHAHSTTSVTEHTAAQQERERRKETDEGVKIDERRKKEIRQKERGILTHRDI